jgi:hypothetical protein
MLLAYATEAHLITLGLIRKAIRYEPEKDDNSPVKLKQAVGLTGGVRRNAIKLS